MHKSRVPVNQPLLKSATLQQEKSAAQAGLQAARRDSIRDDTHHDGHGGRARLRHD
jgi:hypothetical protein